MEKIVLYVEGMSCEHCVNAVTKAAGAVPGVQNVSVSLSEGTAVAEYDPALCKPEDLGHAIEEQGYEIKANKGRI